MSNLKGYPANDKEISLASFEQLALGQNINVPTALVGNHKWYRKLLALPAYYWVLIAQIIVILPHAAHLPLWLILKN